MVSEIMKKDGEMENGTSILIDYSEGKITVINGNNGNKPENFIFKIGDSVTVETISADKVRRLVIGKSDNGFNINLENVSKGTESEGIKLATKAEAVSDDRTANISIETEPGVTQTVSLPEEITAEEIKKKLENTIVLVKNEVRILIVLLESGSATRKEICEATGISNPDISVHLRRLSEELHLIYYDEKFIKPYCEKIKNFFPWIFIIKIQKVISELNFKKASGPKLVFGELTSQILYLLYKYPNGLTMEAIIHSSNLSYAAFYRTIDSMFEKGLIKVKREGRRATIFPNFSVDQTGENPATFKNSAVVEIGLVQETAEAEEPIANLDIAKEFNIRKLASFLDMINRGPMSLQKLSSQFEAEIQDGKLTELLNVIDDVIGGIEIVEKNTDTVMTSWEPKDFNGIAFEKLEVRKKTGISKEEDVKAEDIKTEEQNLSVDSNADLVESEDGSIKTNRELVSAELDKSLDIVDRNRLTKNKKTVSKILLGNEQRTVLEEIIKSGEDGIRIKGARIASMEEEKVADILCWLMDHALIGVKGGFAKTSKTSEQISELTGISVQDGSGVEEPIVDPDIDEKSPVTPTESVGVDLDSAKETKEDEELEDLISMIGEDSVSLQYILSQFGVGIQDRGLTKLLDIINEKIEIDIVEENTDTVMTSWEPKDFNDVNIDNLEVIKKTGTSEKKEDTEIKDEETKGQTKRGNASAIVTENNNPITKPEFPLGRIESVARRIESSPESFDGLNLQHLSSQFKAKKDDGGLKDFLDEINKIVPIEIFDVFSNKVIISWKPKDFKDIKLENLRVRKKTNDLKEGDAGIKEEIFSDSDAGLNTGTAEYEDKEDIIKKINEMIATPYLGGSHKIVMFILFDNYLENDSLEMEVSGLSGLMEIAKKKGLREAEIRECFKGLQSLRFVEKPDKTIKLKIKT